MKTYLFDEGVHFQSCHASSVLPLEDGVVLAAYFAGTAEKHPDVGIWLSRRVGGRWEAPVRIAKTEPAAHWNPVLFPTGDGGVRVVYRVGASVETWKSRTMVSRDGGVTWSAERRYPAPYDACGPVRSRPVLLRDGRLLAPNSGESADGWFPRVDVSTDGGETFAPLSPIPINNRDPGGPDYMSGKGAIQPALWESAQGRVHALLRTTCGRIFRSDSADGGRTWCRAYDTGLPNNNSGIDVAAAGDDLYLVFNPVAGNWAARTPLVVHRSRDNGRTFLPFAVLEDAETDGAGNAAEFSYPSAAVRDNTLHITYTHLRSRIAYCWFKI